MLYEKKMKFIWIVIFIFCIVLTNLLWFIQTDRLDSRVRYHATHICELQRLITLKEQIPLGMDLKKLNEMCNSDEFNCDQSKNFVHIDWASLADCPDSGRPYCGYVVKIKNNAVVSIVSGYPCH